MLRNGHVGDRFADFWDSGVFRIDIHIAHDRAVAMQANGRVLNVEIDHVGAGNLLEELVVFAPAQGGNIAQAVVDVDRFSVRVGRVKRTREDIEDGDAVPSGKPVVNGKRERKGSVVAVRRKDQDVQRSDSVFSIRLSCV